MIQFNQLKSPKEKHKMKYRKILLILAIATLSSTACKKEQNLAPAETTAIEENAVETETTDNNAEISKDVIIEGEGNNGEGIVDRPSTEDFTETQGALDPSNITLNEDGTYGFTDEFLVAVQTINGAAGLTDDRLDIALQNAADAIINMGLDNEQDIISTIETEIAIQEYNQFKEQANQGGGNSNNGGSQQTQQNQNQSQGGNSGNTSSGGQDQVAPGPVQEQGAMDNIIAGLLQEGTDVNHDENAETGGVGTSH